MLQVFRRPVANNNKGNGEGVVPGQGVQKIKENRVRPTETGRKRARDVKGEGVGTLVDLIITSQKQQQPLTYSINRHGTLTVIQAR